MRTQLIGKIEFDQARLADDVERSLTINFTEPYEEYVCGHPWKSAMLWAPGGGIHSTISEYDSATPPAFTAHCESLPYIKEIIEKNFNLKNVTFVRMIAFSNGVLVPHCDYVELSDPAVKQRIAHRLHVVLTTAQNCMFNETDTVYHMKAGEVWFIDVTRPHSAAVLGDMRRIHLLIDFADVADVKQLLNFDITPDAGIPQANLCDRPVLTSGERDGLLSLASVIDQQNLMDIFGIVIKKHYCKDGGPNFVWSTIMEIGRLSNDALIAKRLTDLYKHTNIERIEYSYSS